MPPARNELDLFKPGPGGVPPYLAGREREQQICRAFLDRLRQGAAPPRDLILYGPRGKSMVSRYGPPGLSRSVGRHDGFHCAA